MTNDKNYNPPDQYEEFDDFADEGMDDGVAGEPPAGVFGRLADAWHNNPGFKIGTIIIGGVTLVGSAFALLDPNKKVDPAAIGSAANVAGAPGGEVSPEVKKITDEANSQRAAEALNAGGSAVITPQATKTEVVEQKPVEPALDPLEQWRIAEQKNNTPIAPPTAGLGTTANTTNGAVAQKPDNSGMVAAMSEQMKGLLQAWGPISPTVVTFNQPAAATAPNAGATTTTNVNGTPVTTVTAQNNAAVVPKKILQVAGEIRYGVLITEANSDVPNTPILASVTAGPLRGARIIGQFEEKEGDYLILRFNRLIYKGKDYPADIVAVDPNTTLAGLATETDQRYISRVVIPAATSFLRELGNALRDQGTETSIVGSTVIQTKKKLSTKEANYAGLGGAADTVGQFAQQEGAKIKPLVRVASGTELGLLFAQSITDPPTGDLAQPAVQVPTESTNPPATTTP